MLEGPDDHMTVIYVEIKNQETKHFPDNIGKLFPELKYIRNDNSQLQFVTKQSFENMKNVKDLILTHNLIEMIPQDAFHDLKSLETIDLSHNKLRHLHKDLFIHNPNLMRIVATDNEIELLEADLFDNNKNLTAINFDRNKLIAIKPNFDTTRDYELLSFHDNDCIDSSYPESMDMLVELSFLFEEIFLKCYGPFFIDPR